MNIPSVSVWKAGNGIFIEYFWEYLWETGCNKHLCSTETQFFSISSSFVFFSVPESLCYAPYVSVFVSHRIASVCLSSYHFFSTAFSTTSKPELSQSLNMNLICNALP